MSGSEAARNVVKLIRCAITNEDKIEQARITLAKDAKFSCRQSFRRIDTKNKGYIQESDLREFLRLNGIFPNENDLERYYSQKRLSTSNISYDEFVNQTLSQSNLDMRDRCLQNDRSEKFFELDASETRKINKLVTTIFEREFRFIKEIDFILKELRLDHFEAEVHQYLYDVNKEEVTYARIKEYMEKNHSHLERPDFDALARRIDSSGFGKISLFDFLSFFYPFVKPREKPTKLNQNHPILSESHNYQNTSTYYKNENYYRKSHKDIRMNPRNQVNQAASSYMPDMILLSSCKGFQSRPLSSRGQSPKPSLYLERKKHIENLSSIEIHKRLSNYHKVEGGSQVYDHLKCSQQRRLPLQVETRIDEIEDLKNPFKYRNPNCFYRKYYSSIPRKHSHDYY